MLSEQFRQALLDLDIRALRAMWKYLAPHQPQPQTDLDCLTTAHMARCAMQSMPIKARKYSYRWLVERGLPSQLPDGLKPSAERIYPIVAEAVAISCKSKSKALQPVFDQVQKAMQEVVLDAYAGTKPVDADKLKGAMQEAREKTLGQLLGK